MTPAKLSGGGAVCGVRLDGSGAGKAGKASVPCLAGPI